jgi:hypothetical protein
MKTPFQILFSLTVVLILSSCTRIIVIQDVPVKHDNGLHKGWYKNPNNPHNPAHSSNGKVNNGKGNKGKGHPGGQGKGNSGKGKKSH